MRGLNDNRCALRVDTNFINACMWPLEPRLLLNGDQTPRANRTVLFSSVSFGTWETRILWSQLYEGGLASIILVNILALNTR